MWISYESVVVFLLHVGVFWPVSLVTLICVLASIRLDTEGIDLLCALLQVGHQSPVTPADLRDL